MAHLSVVTYFSSSMSIKLVNAFLREWIYSQNIFLLWYINLFLSKTGHFVNCYIQSYRLKNVILLYPLYFILYFKEFMEDHMLLLVNAPFLGILGIRKIILFLFLNYTLNPTLPSDYWCQ